MRIMVAALFVLLVAASSASADTIVYRRGTDIWRMAPDGSGQTALTGGERRYEWPSAADDGTIVASDEVGQLWRMSLDGVVAGPPIPTAATSATDDVPAETPTHVRISPDGTRIAYDEVIDGDATTLWTPAAATGPDFPGQLNGQVGLVTPSWVGSGALLLSRDVASDDPGATFSLFGIGGEDGSADPWFSDSTATWATGFDAAASRSGTRIAVMEDDAADQDGVPAHVVLRLFTADAPGADPAFRCQLPLEATDTYSSASPTFSPDGTRLAWAQSDGIHVANLGALDDCGAIREQVVTLPGAWEPYWTPGDAERSGRRRQTHRAAHADRPHPRAPAPGDAAQARPAGAGHAQRPGNRARLGARRGQETLRGRDDRPRRRRHDHRVDPPAQPSPPLGEAAGRPREHPRRQTGDGHRPPPNLTPPKGPDPLGGV